MVYEDIATAICKILSTAKTRQYVVTARGVARALGSEIPPRALRAALNRYGFKYMRVGSVDVGKYVVDVESAREICRKIEGRTKKKSRF